MPYSSPKQERLMRAVAHSPGFAKKVGIPQAVGRKFEAHKAEGGPVKESAMKKIFGGKETKAEEAKELRAVGGSKKKYAEMEAKFEPGKHKGKPFAKGGGIESKGKTKGKMVKMAMGGKAC